MPWTCFKYPADVPPGARSPNAVQPVKPGSHGMPETICFSHPGDAPRGMPFSCFSYSAEAPLGSGNRDVAEPGLPGLRRMPNICFRY
jgi:hypothetical protein